MRATLFLLLTASLLPAQTPRVGVVDYYGIHKVPENRVRKVVDVQPGQTLPASKGDIEERLEAIPGVVQARVEAVCCDGNRAILYVGIEEKGAPRFEVRAEPSENVDLPAPVFQSYRSFLAAFQRAAEKGVTGENFSEGHSLSADPATRAIQETFPPLADANLNVLRQVLRGSLDNRQRAAAAYIIGYATKKKAVVDDLQYALRDPSEAVRANAMRSLQAIAAFADTHPDLGIRVEPTWFVEMLNSLVWSDRYHAASVLVQLTESRHPSTLQEIRDRALNSIVEMAQWHTLQHALPAFIILGRLGGATENQIHAAWENPDRAQAVLGFLHETGIKK